MRPKPFTIRLQAAQLESRAGYEYSAQLLDAAGNCIRGTCSTDESRDMLIELLREPEVQKELGFKMEIAVRER